jgi:rSAM/selenodomain-associated transferase 2
LISVIIPTLNAAAGLGATLGALVPGAVEGVVGEVIIVDGGSTDATLAIADACGATIVTSEPGRGRQLKAGAAQAKGQWLLFLHADTVLDGGWIADAIGFQQRVTDERPAAAVFTFAMDDHGLAPWLVEAGVRLRSTLLKLPYGDQGLLISRALYDEIGGYANMPIMEDVDIIRRLGRRRVRVLRTAAVTSAKRYRNHGYAQRIIRNLICLGLYSIGVSPLTIQRIYG